MKTASLRYTQTQGWCDFPDLDRRNTLVLLFGASSLGQQPEIFDELRAAYPNSTIVGCSSAGEISGHELLDDTIVGSVVAFDDVEIRSVALESAPGCDSLKLGEELARSLPDVAGKPLAAVFVLANGLNVNGSALVDGIDAFIPSNVPVTGGLAGDGDRFERTWVLHDAQPHFQKTVAIGFYGAGLAVSHGTRAGWDEFGPERRITRSRDNVLFELDRQPALDLYKLYLGDHAKDLPASGLLFPLEVYPPGRSGDALVRTILAVDEDEKSLVFAGDVPEGHLARLMKSNFDRLIAGASESSQTATAVGHHGPTLAIAISCVGRRLVLQERALEEIAAVLNHLPDPSHLVGFYSYGEIAPRRLGGNPYLHNQTMTLTILSER